MWVEVVEYYVGWNLCFCEIEEIEVGEEIEIGG